MKRGDIAAPILFLVQAALALLHARRLVPDVPGLGDQYFNISVLPLSESLRSIRTLGYPLFHAIMERLGIGLEDYPQAQMLLLIGCCAIFAFGLRKYGLSSLSALAAASPLLWVVPTTLVMPETPAKCFAIAAIGFLLWSAGTRSPVALIGLAASLFLTYQMRPAFLFMLVFLPVCWCFLYVRRWGLIDPRRGIRQGLYTAGACVLPLFLFCLLRLILVGHFGLVSFGGQNTVGISVELLTEDSAKALPMEDRPLAMLLARARDGWPIERFITDRGYPDDWEGMATQYSANVNRIGRAVQAKFPPAGSSSDNVAQDKAFSRMSQRTFIAEWRRYRAWLVGAAIESCRVAADLSLGGRGGMGFGLSSIPSLAIGVGLIALLLLSGCMERRAFGEGSRPFSGHGTTIVLVLAGLFFFFKMLLVILVEPPIPRYVQAALFLVPSVASLLLWERCVILMAALCNRPYWYGQCLVAYPAVPDAHQPIAWRALAHAWRPRRPVAVTALVIVFIVALVGWWSTREDRFFKLFQTRPDVAREALIADADYNTWRDSQGASVLHYGALLDDEVLVNHLLNDPALGNITSDDEATPLHWVAMGKTNGNIVPSLITGGLSPDAPGPLGLSPVHLAALSGNASVLTALLDHGGNANATTPAQVAPLHLAQSVAIAAILMEHGAAVDVPDGSEATPFMWAHTQKLASFFLEQGADINAAENWRSFVRQCTPLHKAVYQKDFQRARWLLKEGADPNRGDINGFTPLFYALWRNDRIMIELLLDYDAHIDQPGRWLTYNRDDPTYRFTDIYGKTLGRHPRRNTFGKLVPDEAGLRPLDWVAFLGNQDLIRLLVDHGANLTLKNEEGMSALHWAILGFQGKAEKLLEGLANDPAIFDSATLPLAEFRTSVQAGRRTFNETVPTAKVDATLMDKAQRLADEYEAGAANILEGDDGFLFTRQACQFLLQKDLRYAEPGIATSGPSPAMASIVDIDHQLKARGIHLIVVPAPLAIESHADAFFPGWDRSQPAFPPRGEFINGLCEAGVDAIDLLPAFVAHRLAEPEDALYLKEDGHWSSLAIGLAADVLSKNIRALDLPLDLDRVAYGEVLIDYEAGLTPIARRLPESHWARYENTVWPVSQVLQQDGNPYVDDEQSPVLVVGDSYTLLFNEVSGHLSARLAQALGRPVASHLAKAAGPTIPRVLARKGKEYIDARKVIIWVFSSGYIRPTGNEQWGNLELP